MNFICKRLQPGLNGFQWHAVQPMLPWVDIAMATFEVALGENVEKNVGGVSGKGNGLG